MAAATSSITEASLYRGAHQLHAAASLCGLGRLGPKNGIKKVVTLVSDYGPGIDAEKFFNQRLTFKQRRPGDLKPCACRCATRLRPLPAEGA